MWKEGGREETKGVLGPEKEMDRRWSRRIPHVVKETRDSSEALLVQ